MSEPEPPLAILLELTHRCPLRCPYCSNPVELERRGQELDTATWRRVIEEAAALVACAAGLGLYSTRIPAGVLLAAARVGRLVEPGRDHVQLSIQDADPAQADRIGGLKGGYARKLEAARWVRAAGLPLTVNAPVHRQNLERLEQIIALAIEMGAERLEVAHVQYYGWGLKNRAALMPTRAQLERATEAVEAARVRLKGVLVIDYVVPDYYAEWPKSCMGGWARQFLNVTPSGKVLPCHAAETIPELAFESVTARSLAEIWRHSPAFNRFRGTSWMPEPCRSCERREIDWGGCRCQALAITGDAAKTDPACCLSPQHDKILALAETESARAAPAFDYRQMARPVAVEA